MLDPSFSPLPARLSDELVTQLQALFDAEWWSGGRSRDEVVRIIEGSFAFVGTVDADGALASFARVVSDGVTFAVVLDVIVRADLRGHGLGARLVDDILRHPDLQALRGIGLQCEERLVPFYERWGFSDAVGRSRQMKLVFDTADGERPADRATGGAP